MTTLYPEIYDDPLVERSAVNREVVGSSLPRATFFVTGKAKNVEIGSSTGLGG